MNHKCPNCGHRFDDHAQAKAAKARWKNISKSERSIVAKKAAKVRWDKRESIK